MLLTGSIVFGFNLSEGRAFLFVSEEFSSREDADPTFFDMFINDLKLFIYLLRIKMLTTNKLLNHSAINV